MTDEQFDKIIAEIRKAQPSRMPSLTTLLCLAAVVVMVGIGSYGYLKITRAMDAAEQRVASLTAAANATLDKARATSDATVQMARNALHSTGERVHGATEAAKEWSAPVIDAARGAVSPITQGAAESAHRLIDRVRGKPGETP